MVLNTGFSGDLRLAKNVLLAAKILESPVFLFAKLFEETHPQPFREASGWRGCVDGKDGGRLFAGICL